MMVMELTSLTDAVSADAQQVAAGKVVFAQCEACHSVDGTDGAGPSLMAGSPTFATAAP
jgi:cytochrome c